MSQRSLLDSRASRRRQLETTAAELVHCAMSAEWSCAAASARLLDRAGGDRRLLLLLRARVARHLMTSPTRVGRRAAAAIETALQQETGSPLAGAGTVGHQREKGQAAHA